jgi:transposase
MMKSSEKRYIGVDLHQDNFLVCTRAGGEQQFRRWKVEQVEEFAGGLRGNDELAVEATGNTRWFCQAIGAQVGRIVVVNPHQFRVISQSVKKTDRRDAALLAQYLEKDLLPEVRRKTSQESEMAQLVSARDQLVKMRTMLKNQLHGLLRSYGLRVNKQGLNSAKQRREVSKLELPMLADVQRGVLLEQIHSVGRAILELERHLKPAAEQLPGYRNLRSIRGIGALSAGVLLSAIGRVQDFSEPGKLAAYFGMVPRVQQSNQSEHHGRITRAGNKLARTTLVQCALIAKRYNPTLKQFYDRVRHRRGTGKAILATARKLLALVYYTLKNNWIFSDSDHFVLAA